MVTGKDGEVCVYFKNVLKFILSSWIGIKLVNGVSTGRKSNQGDLGIALGSEI